MMMLMSSMMFHYRYRDYCDFELSMIFGCLCECYEMMTIKKMSFNEVINVNVIVMGTYPMVHEGSEPDRTRGIWIVPSLWKLSSSMPSEVKQGMSQRMCDPRNSSAEPRNGALGVRRRFCFALTPTTGLLSKIDTKLGIWLFEFHCSWSGIESSESGVALLDREPVLHV